ncbi:MAG: response regulator transcription factor [Methylacidiphilales bacterium]|nr:response regulator transcription factor [Candidatus Methylacidiphilales bacterium]
MVDDHPIVRQGFRLLIDAQPDLAVCGEAADAAPALQDIITLKPDVVLVDISLKAGSGLELVKDLAAREKNVATLVVSLHDETVYAERVLHAGARGFVMKVPRRSDQPDRGWNHRAHAAGAAVGGGRGGAGVCLDHLAGRRDP